MAHGQHQSSATTIVAVVLASSVTFGLGFFVGSRNVQTNGAAPEGAGAIGGARSPSFAQKKGNSAAPTRGTHNGPDSDILPIGKSPILGPADAPVTIVEFSDYQCPFCDKVGKTLKQVQAKYPNDVRIVFKNFPLGFHKQAPDASAAAIAAGQQGKYWEMHDKLFANYRNFKNKDRNAMKDLTAGYAAQIGLDVEKFKADFENDALRAQIKEDQKLGGKVGVRGTPHSFVNGERISGAVPLQKWEDAVKRQLAASRKALETGTSKADLYKVMVKKNYKKAEAPKPRGQQAANIQYVPVNPKDAVKGNTKDYLVTIIEFSDYQCPFCSRGDTTIMKVLEKYKGNTRLVFKHLPLAFHKEAEPASRGAIAAGMQGKFWEYHAEIFKRQKELKTNKEIFIEIANKLGLNIKKFETDFNDPKTEAQVKADLALAQKVGARGTPNFFVNGINVVGAQPEAKFAEVIDKQIAKAKALQKSKGLKGEALYKELVAINKKEAPKAAPKPSAPAAKVDPKLLKIGNSYVKGNPKAAISIYEFSDFQCPFCSRANNTIQQVAKKYEGKVNIVFKNFPLAFHKEAMPAHRAAIAAGKQGKFWEMHDLLFDNAKSFRGKGDAGMAELVKGYASQIGLNIKKFEADYNDPKTEAQVKAEMAEGSKVGVRGTPNFFINGKRITGAQPAATFEAAIEEALKAKK